MALSLRNQQTPESVVEETVVTFGDVVYGTKTNEKARSVYSAVRYMFSAEE